MHTIYVEIFRWSKFGCNIWKKQQLTVSFYGSYTIHRSEPACSHLHIDSVQQYEMYLPSFINFIIYQFKTDRQYYNEKYGMDSRKHGHTDRRTDSAFPERCLFRCVANFWSKLKYSLQGYQYNDIHNII